MRKEKRRRPLWGAFEDPWRKLAAILLAIGLWFYLDAQVTRKLEMQPQVLFNKQVDAVNRIYVSMSSLKYTLSAIQDGDSRVNLPGNRVALEFEGPRHLIEQLEKDPVFQVQELATNVITQGDVSFITFRAEDLRHHKRPDFNELLTGMTPSTVRIVLDKNADKTLVLDFENIALYDVDDDLKDRIRKAKTRFEPSTLTIFGPEDKLQGIGTTTRLFRGTFTEADVRDRTELMIKLERTKDEALSWVQLDQTPTATFEIEPDWKEYQLLDVPIVVDTVQVGEDWRAKYQLEQTNITVKIRATGRLNTLLWQANEGGLVNADWVSRHARFRIYMSESDLSKDRSIEFRPTIELFTVDGFGGIEQIFVLDVDFKQDKKTLITLKKRKS